MIPLATTSLTVQRQTQVPGDDGIFDPDDDVTPTFTTVVSGVRAVVSLADGTVQLAAGDHVVYNAKFTSDPMDVQTGDVVTDSTGQTWLCLSAALIVGFGLDHIEGTLRFDRGAS